MGHYSTFLHFPPLRCRLVMAEHVRVLQEWEGHERTERIDTESSPRKRRISHETVRRSGIKNKSKSVNKIKC